MRRCVGFIVAMALLPAAAMAAAPLSSFEVAPTTVDLAPGKPGLFYIANRGAEPVTIQIQTMDWHQADNADSLAPSNTLYASPPLVHIAPGERQTIRLLCDCAGRAEGDYRLIVSQLPQPATDGAVVDVLLQFSVPVFVAAAAPPPPSIAWSASQRGDSVEIAAANHGGNALKLSDMLVSASDKATARLGGGLSYVLPGAVRAWRVALPAQAASLHLTARDERSGAALDTQIAVQR